MIGVITDQNNISNFCCRPIITKTVIICDTNPIYNIRLPTPSWAGGSLVPLITILCIEKTLPIFQKQSKNAKEAKKHFKEIATTIYNLPK